MHTFDPRRYGPAAAVLLEGAGLNELGPGGADASLRPRLAQLTPESLMAPRKILDRAMAAACLAGLWLRYDFLDESHRISQELENPSGSYWHGIMHRREGDFENAKYWFRRVGDHPTFAALWRVARDLAGRTGVGEAAYLSAANHWDPLRFVDLCRPACGSSTPLEAMCRSIQRCEWELLFDHCYQQAIGQ